MLNFKGCTLENSGSVRVQKQEFYLENIPVGSFHKLNLLFFPVSMLITFMTLKLEKKNAFFHAVIVRAQGINSEGEIRIYLYRFPRGMKAILDKYLHGIEPLNSLKTACLYQVCATALNVEVEYSEFCVSFIKDVLF